MSHPLQDRTENSYVAAQRQTKTSQYVVVYRFRQGHSHLIVGIRAGLQQQQIQGDEARNRGAYRKTASLARTRDVASPILCEPLKYGGAVAGSYTLTLPDHGRTSIFMPER